MSSQERVQVIADALLNRTHTSDQLQKIRDLFVKHEEGNLATVLNKEDDWDPTTITEEEKADVVLAVLYRSAYAVMGTAARRLAAEAVANVEDEAAEQLKSLMEVE